MRILALDSSGMVASAALVEDDILRAEYTLNYKKTHSQTLLPLLDKVLTETETEPSQVDAIAVSAGPGSFTGLRIGAATAKGLGLALDKPLIAVPTLEALAYNLWGYPGRICPMMDARRDQVYTGLYQFEGSAFKTLREGEALSLEALIAILEREEGPVLFLGDGVPVHRRALEERLSLPLAFAPAHLNRQRAAAVGALGRLYLEKGRTVSAAAFSPIYLRLPQAERERRKKRGALLSRLEAEIFADPWSERALEESLTQSYCHSYLWQEEGEVQGYCLVTGPSEDWEILRIGVRPAFRRRGIATGLLGRAAAQAKDRGARRLLLEVRAGNQEALAFYQALGFQQDGLRRDYYEDPREDALLMHLDLEEVPGELSQGQGRILE